MLAAVVFLAATLLHAAPLDPYPNQPDALSLAEIQEAKAAMKAILGGEPALPLVASGKRAPEHVMPSYAFFATPPKKLSDRVTTRRQVVCNYSRPMGKWQCAKPYTELRMSAQGINHVFPHIVNEGAEDPQTAVDVADYMYSACFAAQFKALGGKEPAPPFNRFPIAHVVSQPGGFLVRTGPDDGGDGYQLEKTDKKADGCGFRIVGVRMYKTGLVLPEGYEKLAAEQAAKVAAAWREKEVALQRERERATPAPAVVPETTDRIGLLDMVLLIAVPIAAAIFAGRYALASEQPWIALRRGFYRTWVLSIAFGIATGIFIDVISGGRHMIAATVVFFMMHFGTGFVAGVIVGAVCGVIVWRRQRSEPQ